MNKTDIIDFFILFFCQGKLFGTTVSDEATWTLGK